MTFVLGLHSAVHQRLVSECTTSGRVCPLAAPFQGSLVGQGHSASLTPLLPTGSRRAQRAQLQVVCAIKRSSEKNIVCSKTLVATPGKERKVLQRCRDIVDFSKGRMAVRSNGLLSFECFQDRFEPNVFHFWERYEGNVAMGRHNNTPEFQTFMKEIQVLLTEPIGMALYEWKDGHIGQQCIQGGPKGEGGLDDATGAGGAGGASMKQSSNTVDLGKVRRGDEGDAFGMGFKFPWQKKKK